MSVVARDASIERVILVCHAPPFKQAALLASLIQKLVETFHVARSSRHNVNLVRFPSMDRIGGRSSIPSPPPPPEKMEISRHTCSIAASNTRLRVRVILGNVAREIIFLAYPYSGGPDRIMDQNCKGEGWQASRPLYAPSRSRDIAVSEFKIQFRPRPSAVVRSRGPTTTTIDGSPRW